jgi:hypothetical protein
VEGEAHRRRRRVAAAAVDGGLGEALGLVLHDEYCINSAPQHQKEEEGCRCGGSPKRGRGGAAPTRNDSDDGEEGMAAPRETPRQGSAPRPAHGDRETMRRAVCGGPRRPEQRSSRRQSYQSGQWGGGGVGQEARHWVLIAAHARAERAGSAVSTRCAEARTSRRVHARACCSRGRAGSSSGSMKRTRCCAALSLHGCSGWRWPRCFAEAATWRRARAKWRGAGRLRGDEGDSSTPRRARGVRLRAALLVGKQLGPSIAAVQRWQRCGRRRQRGRGWHGCKRCPGRERAWG